MEVQSTDVMIYFVIFSNLLFLLVGVYIGSKLNSYTTIDEDGKKVMSGVKNVFKSKSDLMPGVIRRPSAKEVYYKNKPEDERKADEAMVETLKKFPELNKKEGDDKWQGLR